MADFFTDTFVDADTTLLQNHTSDSGHDWFASFAGGSNNLRIQANRVWIDGSSYRYAKAETPPPSADYQVETKIRVLSLAGSAGPAVRSISNTDAYVAFYEANPAQVSLWRLSTGGAHTQIGSTASLATPSVNDLVTVRLKAEGTSLQVYVDDVLEIDASDGNITAAGTAGIRMTASMSTTTGLHIEEMRAFTGDEGVTGTLDATEVGDDEVAVAGIVGTVVIPDFLLDNFNDLDGQVISSHESDSGHDWVHGFASSTGLIKIQSNRVYLDGPGYRYGIAIVDAPSPDYSVEIGIRVLTTVTQAGAVIRATGGNGNPSYLALYSNSPSRVRLFRHVDGVHDQIGLDANVDDPEINDLVRIRVKAEGFSIQVFHNDIMVLDETDFIIEGAGRPGFRLGATQTTTTGLHIEYIRAFTGDAPETGIMDAIEIGDDAVAIAGGPIIGAILDATEIGDDVVVMIGAGSLLMGTMDATEIGDDIAAFVAEVFVSGTLDADEVGDDVVAITATVHPDHNVGTLDATEIGDDVVEIFGTSEQLPFIEAIVEIEFVDFILRDIKWNASTITGELVLEDLTREPYPAGRFTPSSFPGLF